jgi:hypothetical protein
MATLEQLEMGLRKADAAGNVDDAKVFAAEIRRLRGAAPRSESGIPGQRQTRSWADVPKEAVMSAPGSIAGQVKGLIDVGAGSLRNVAQTVLPQGAFETVDMGAGGPEASAAATAAVELPRGLRQQVLRTLLGDKAAAVLDVVSAAPITPATVGMAGGVPQAVTPAAQTMERAGQTGSAIVEHYKGYLDPEELKRRIATDPAAVAADISMLAGGLKYTANAAGAPRVAAPLAAVERYTNPLTPVQAAGRAGVNAMASGTEFIRNYLDPKMAAYMDAAEGRAPAIIEQLRANRQYVPGSLPTAAQAAVEAGAPKFAAMGESAAQTLPAEFQARKMEQAAARARSLQENVAGTPAELEALRAQREANARAGYREGAFQEPAVPESGPLRALFGRPSMNSVLRRAEAIANERGRPFTIGENVPAREVAGMRTPEQFREFPVESLHDIKTAFDDIIKDPATFGIGAKEAQAIASTRAQFLRWFEENVPAYAEARGTYRTGSVPINQREVGQYLESKLLSPLSEEAPQRANAFAEAVRNAPATLQRSVEGTQRFSTLDQILSPDQVAAIDNIRLDLAREAKAKQQATAGRATAPTLNKLASEAEPGARLPNMMSRITNVANRILGALERKIDKKLAIEIATEMLNPETAAIALERAAAKSAGIAEQGARIRQRGAAGLDILSQPATLPIVQLQNIMSNRENRNAMAR